MFPRRKYQEDEMNAALKKAEVLKSRLESDNSPDLAIMAGEIVTILDALLAAQPPERKDYQTSRYKLKSDYEVMPDATGTVQFNQPAEREVPLWYHTVTCPYCNVTVSLETFSPTPPATCGQDACVDEHHRVKARERKRRQRARDKAAQHKRKHQ